VTRLVVIGAGIAGLAAALDATRRGAEVTVVESAAEVGGKLTVSELAGIAVDEGAEAFIRRVPEALELVEQLGRSDELVTPRPVPALVWARGRLRAMPTATVMGVPSDPNTLRGVLSDEEVARVAEDAQLPGDPPGEDVSVGEWVQARVGAAVVDRLVDPLLAGVYAGRARDLSLAATLPQLPRDERSLLAAARRVVAPEPSTDPIFATLTAGMGSLPGSVATALTTAGAAIRTGRTVRRIERTASGWRIVHGPTTEEQMIDADAVIVATPAAASARLLADVAPAAAAELAAIDSASMGIVTLAWRNADVPTIDASGYLVPAVYGRPVKAVTFASRKWEHLSRPDLVVVRCSIGRAGEVAELQRDDADLVTTAAEELRHHAGFTGVPIDSRVTRWGGALPQYAVGHLGRVARIRAAVAAVPGLAVCGATYDGVGIPACIRSAHAATAQLLGATSPGAR